MISLFIEKFSFRVLWQLEFDDKTHVVSHNVISFTSEYRQYCDQDLELPTERYLHLRDVQTNIEKTNKHWKNKQKHKSELPLSWQDQENQVELEIYNNFSRGERLQKTTLRTKAKKYCLV